MKNEKGKPFKINLGKEQYINRLAAFIEDHSASSRFTHIVGSHLSFIGDRLDRTDEMHEEVRRFALLNSSKIPPEE